MNSEYYFDTSCTAITSPSSLTIKTFNMTCFLISGCTDLVLTETCPITIFIVTDPDAVLLPVDYAECKHSICLSIFHSYTLKAHFTIFIIQSATSETPDNVSVSHSNRQLGQLMKLHVISLVSLWPFNLILRESIRIALYRSACLARLDSLAEMC